MRSTIQHYQSQQGVVLLAFALILLIGSSYLLTKTLNSDINYYDRRQESNNYLKQAEQALIGWSLNHPDNPGMMLFPDRNTDGDYDGNSDCTNFAVNNALLSGRLPWRGQDNPCRAPQTGLNIVSEDFIGQELWYAVSSNLVYESPEYPFVSTSLLNTNTNWITVRDQNGNVISDRVAFVLISPGVALPGQDRSAVAPDAVNFLDNVTVGGINYSNADNDQDFIIYPDSDYTADTTDSFNDQLVFVTIDEFMDRLEQRVMNELSNILTTYHTVHGAFPWLSPFSDPKSKVINLNGSADAGSTATLLIDATKDFVLAGVQQNDLVYNITDQSIGVVSVDPSGASPNQISISGLVLGDDNDFDQDDQYYILVNNLQDNLSGNVALLASNFTTLTDNQIGLDFTETDLQVGDTLENVTDGSAGTIVNIGVNQIEVNSLTGGTDNDFDDGDEYRVRTNFGEATANGGSPIDLIDGNTNFITMGVQVGDVVWNLTDGSISRVDEVLSDTTLSLGEQYFGVNNSFSFGDEYMIPGFNAVDNTRLGKLAFHEVAEPFPTELNLTWDITVNSGDISFDTVNFPLAQATYRNNLTAYLTNYADAGTQAFTSTNATCIWSVPRIAECYAVFDDFETTAGRNTSGLNTSLINDANATFISDGISRGDIALNYDDEIFVDSGVADAGSTGTTLVDAAADFSGYERYSYLIQNNTLEGELGVGKIQGKISDTIGTDTLIAESYEGEGETDIEFRDGDNYAIYQARRFVVTSVNSENQVDTDNLESTTNPDFDFEEQYRIVSASSSFSATADSTSPTRCTNNNSCIISDVDGDFINKGIEIGDVVELNVTTIFFGTIFRTGFGIITNVSANTLTFVPYGNFLTWINPTTNDYTVYYDYRFSRKHEWRTRIRGNQVTKTVDQERLRDVCVGYNADCTVTAATAFSINGNETMITVRDYQEDGTTEVGRAEFTPSAASSGSLLVSNMKYYLSELSNDIPAWFIRNKWYQYFYFAYSSGGDIPGTATPCTAGTDCLVVNVDPPVGNTQDNVRAMIIYSGRELTNQPQTLASGNIQSYFEGDVDNDALENADGDDTFDKSIVTNGLDANSRAIQSNYNDKIKVAVSCDPPGDTNLCWR